MISRIDIEDMTDAQDEAPERIWLQDPVGLDYERTWCAEPQSDDDTPYIRADIARPSQAEDERVARALGVVAAMLQGEAERQAGVPFSGTWSIPDYNWRGTVDDALDMADAALAAMDTPKGGGDE